MNTCLYDKKNKKRMENPGRIDILTWAVCLFLLLFPIDSALGDVFGSISINNYVAIGCLGLLFFSSRKVEIKLGGVILFVYLYFLAVTMTYSPFPLSGRNVIVLFYGVFAILIGFTCWTKREKDLMLAATLFGGIAALLIIFLNIRAGADNRIYISVGRNIDQNYFALNFIFFTVVVTQLIFTNKKYRFAFIGLLLFELAMILALGSRTGLLANIAVVCVVVFLHLKNPEIYLLAIPLILLAYFFLLGLFPEWMAERFDYWKILSGTGSGRTEIWKEYWKVFVDSPFFNKLFGYGRSVIYAYKDLGVEENSTHNLYIKALIEGGIIGVAFLIFLFAGIIAHGVKGKNKALFAVFLGYCVGGLFLDVDDYRIAYVTYMFFFVFADRDFDFLKKDYSMQLEGEPMAKEKKIVSIIVPVYNVKEYLEECVNSLLAQTYEELEIILVDDGAKDGSGELCDELAALDTRIRVIHKENGGLSSARNAGIEVAVGEYLIFVDADDYLNKESVETLMRIGDETDADIAVGAFYRSQKEFERKKTGQHKVFNAEKALKAMFKEELSVSASGKAYKRELFEEIRFPVGMIYEDYATIPKVAARAKKIVYVDAHVYFYRPNPQSITGVAFSEKRMQFFKIADQISAFVEESFPKLKKAATMRHTRYAIAFYRQVAQSGFENEEIEGFLRGYVKRNILRYTFLTGAPVLSKAYGLAIALSPKTAKKLMRRR